MKEKPIKRSVSELWDDFQAARLRDVHLDAYRFDLMQSCYFAGIRDFLTECERIGRKQPNDSNAVGAYVHRCLCEVEEYGFKTHARMKRGATQNGNSLFSSTLQNEAQS